MNISFEQATINVRDKYPVNGGIIEELGDQTDIESIELIKLGPHERSNLLTSVYISFLWIILLRAKSNRSMINVMILSK